MGNIDDLFESLFICGVANPILAHYVYVNIVSVIVWLNIRVDLSPAIVLTGPMVPNEQERCHFGNTFNILDLKGKYFRSKMDTKTS